MGYKLSFRMSTLITILHVTVSLFLMLTVLLQSGKGGGMGALGGGNAATVFGGSVKPSNAEALMAEPDIDGALVGGASLEASDFVAIVKAARPT